jgi:hypothetical protein
LALPRLLDSLQQQEILNIKQHSRVHACKYQNSDTWKHPAKHRWNAGIADSVPTLASRDGKNTHLGHISCCLASQDCTGPLHCGLRAGTASHLDSHLDSHLELMTRDWHFPTADPSEYIVGRLLGEGAFGQVCLCEYAVKCTMGQSDDSCSLEQDNQVTTVHMDTVSAGQHARISSSHAGTAG